MQEVSLWLVPQPEDAAYLQGIIDQLAEKYQAPRFRPHVTLAGRLQVSVPYQASLSELAVATPILQLHNQGLDHSTALFRTVYIRTSLADSLVTLREQVYELWPENAVKPFMPHISLIYKEMASSERQLIIQSLRIKETFIFDTLAVVRPQQPGEWTAVETWRTLDQWNLNHQTAEVNPLS
ncbi:2'-5' RNA ligase family protein [Acaryochloris sp. CCMEE 5410]|uniref:2'-5' RNA ligase family protein n=1 Tax=Acaryochloris sp. CCMEE 5410 TaxID=310037 RepID=UPI00024846C2|nr:2'-5' RNA ligase family protein [Acaryochloris sp. CCMEE 5410]KAI9135152.1 2'-5' RNA ligase family protein [Acaryochloris sp. CCMEE 5410]